MHRRKLLFSLLVLLVLLSFAQIKRVHAWLSIKPKISVIVDDPGRVFLVDLLIPVEDAPILLDESEQPIAHPLNGYLTQDGFGSATLYSSSIELIVSEDPAVWTFQSDTVIQTSFHVVVIETTNERFISERWTSTVTYSQANWIDGVFSYHQVVFDRTIDDSPQAQPLFLIVFPYLVILLIAMLDFPLLFYTGFRSKKALLVGGLTHLGIILFLAVLNRAYHLNTDLTYFLILVSTLSVFTIGEAAFFALYFRERSTIRAIAVSIFGMFASSFLLFYFMGLGVF